MFDKFFNGEPWKRLAYNEALADDGPVLKGDLLKHVDVAHMGGVQGELKESDYAYGTFSAPAANLVIKTIHAFNLADAEEGRVGSHSRQDRNDAMVKWLQGARSVIALGVIDDPLMRNAVVRAFTGAINSFGGE